MHAVEVRTIAKVAKRLVPFLIVCYFIAYLDRVNVGFAALTMNQDLGLSQTAFGFGAGIFFIAYFIFEVPSNLLLERFGARKWIARIILSWGILSGTMAFIPAIAPATGLGNENSFYLLRVLLGVAEAGFFPGIIFYLTLWFPAEYRARIVGYFMAAIPLSTVIGAPISGALLYLHGGLGLAGWQWLFIVEALTTLVSASPYVVGTIGMVWWGRRSDRVAERRFHTAFPLFLAAAGIAVSTALDDPLLKMISFCIAGFGIFACLPVFWTLPTAFLSGAAAAAGIAVINSIGNLAGFAGPFAMGWIKDHTGSYAGGLLLLAALGIIAMGIVLMLGHDRAAERALAE